MERSPHALGRPDLDAGASERASERAMVAANGDRVTRHD
jgi:hypothetical protein